MLVLHRRGFGLSRWLAFVLLVSVGGLPVVSLHWADDDPACTRTAFTSTQGPAVGPSAQPAANEHCPVCHAMRGFRIAPAMARLSGIAIARHNAPKPERSRLHHGPSDHRLPTRAPPASQR